MEAYTYKKLRDTYHAADTQLLNSKMHFFREQ